MKIKEGFILRNVADNYVVVPIGEATVDFNGMMSLNETGAFLFGKLIEGIEKDELVEALMEEYDVDQERAEKDVTAFIEKVENEDLFE
ncbi:MAG: PqqD family protein [Eubacterium sp.]|nr:PqqD family protein [Eubacterium sp.]